MQYTGMDMDAFRAGFREQAEKQVKVRLALETVAKLENIEVTEEDIDAEYARFAEQYGMEVDQIKAAIPAEALKQDLSVSKAMEWINANAKTNKKAAKKSTAKSTKSAEKTEEKVEEKNDDK